MDEESFERSVRARHRLGRFSREPCPLDISAANCREFSQGYYEFVEDDLKALPNEIATHVSSICRRQGIISAFAIRRELVNFKKVLQHLLKQCVSVEKQLRQQSAVLHCPILEKTESSIAYIKLSRILMQCQGMYLLCKIIFIIVCFQVVCRFLWTQGASQRSFAAFRGILMPASKVIEPHPTHPRLCCVGTQVSVFVLRAFLTLSVGSLSLHHYHALINFSSMSSARFAEKYETPL